MILNGPGQVGSYQRADGPSPLTVTQEVTPAILAKGTAWSVSIVNFSRSGQAAGTIQLDYPEATPGIAPGKTIPPGTHAPLQPQISGNPGAWLMLHPAVAQAYPSWPEDKKTDLAYAYNAIIHPKPIMPNDPLPNMQQTPDTMYPITQLTEDDAWTLYIGHVAQSLVLEIEHRVPWTLAAYSKSDLAVLLDSRSFFRWFPNPAGYRIEDLDGWVTPAPASIAYAFLRNNNMVKNDRLSTIAALLNWCRGLTHFSGAFTTGNVEKQWQYRGFPPVSRMINGTPYTGQEGTPLGGILNRTAGCHGTAGFLRAVLRAVNIPVLEQHISDHAVISFTTERKYLSHGDDPYSRLTQVTPPFPAAELLIDQTKHNAWFGSGVSDATKGKNIGRRGLELGLQYLPNSLLVLYCQDQAAGRSHATGQVYAVFKNVYTVEQLEGQDLWGRMDAKIAGMGGCGNVHE